MSMHDVQEGLGETGRFGEFFVGLGALIALGGLGGLLSSLMGFPFFPFTGEENVPGMIQTMGLFVVMGIGFATFGVMAVRAGWARHHPDADI